MLTDTGPLVALMDDGEPHHAACVAVVNNLPAGPLQTTWPCFTEAMYLLDSIGGHRLQHRLWQARIDGKLVLLDISANEADRMSALMARYENVPMDLADASLIAVADSRSIRRLFTIDSDFYMYRLADGSVLDILR
jgi:uncharacterized protein